MSVADIFNSMPQRFQVDKAAGANMGNLIDLSGDNGGQWYVNIAEGKLNVSAERAGRHSKRHRQDDGR